MRGCLALLMVFALVLGAGGQELKPEASRALAAMSELERTTLALDIAVSTYHELREMAGGYGLAVEGSSADLRSRLYAFFGLAPPAPAKIAGGILVENAASVQYFSLEPGAGRAVKLSGPLTVKVETDDGFTHTITANEILFDQEALLARAEGDVLYTRSGQGRKDEFRGESVSVDLGNYRGVFIDGSYDLEPGAGRSRSLSFEFRSLSRRSPELSILEDASVTACDEPDPHYRIDAKKVWLFGSGDWALSNATLYVGQLPLLWLPFFYYPADDILFHPVVGYRAREGAFAQTTTYLLGSLPQQKDQASSSLSLFSASEGARERQGLFLRLKPGADEAVSAAANAGSRLALLLDVYSSLGALAGMDGHCEFGSGRSLDAKAALGLSRSIFLESNGYYSPLDSAGGNESVWNGTSVLGTYLPFRFGAEFGFKASGSAPGLRYTISVQAPLFGDPFFEQDFYQRAASGSILSVFDANETALSKRSTMTQSLSGTVSWTRQDAKGASLLESASLSKLAAQMAWKSKAQPTTGLSPAQKRLLAVDPRREFFYPDSLRFLDSAFSLGGKIFKAQSQDLSSTLAWTASGSATGEDKFRSGSWSYPDDVDASLSYLLFGLKGAASLNSDTSLASGLLRLKASLGLNAQSQLRPYLFDERSSPSTVHPYLLADYAYRSMASDISSQLGLNPFPASSPFAASSLSYSIGGKLFTRRYSGLSGSGADASPLYEDRWIAWEKESLTTHALALSLSRRKDKEAIQTLGFSASIPPLLEKYQANYSLSSAYLKAGLQGALSRASESAELTPSALTASLTLGASPYPVLKTDMAWDFTASDFSSIVSSLEYAWAKASFTAKKSKGYALVLREWSADGTDYFRPYETSISLSPRIVLGGGPASGIKDEAEVEPGVETPAAETAAAETAPAKTETDLPAIERSAAGMRLSINPKLAYTQNFVRFTESTLSASIDFSLSSPKGTALGFTASSSNKSAWRYWPGLFPASAGFDPEDYYKSPFTDLAESFSVWDSAALRRSLFKLRGLSLKLSQDLHDWDLSAALTMSPVLVSPDTGRPYYQLDFSFSLGLVWKDIPELKVKASYAEGAFED